ncbi:acetyl-CoA carboxylase biotin carboxyl carrier protein [Pseudomonas viridiflava]|uniref:acetyl-CoA carboxylase biotin carboxyl carrier protein n=1 Tax=Pseudomonas viridiflava TaxID=33069 RepID=UPI000F064B19|nr:biotin/lipoyl-containing protein [Pseudomonas viridiflava]
MNIEQIRQLVADLTTAGLSGAEIDKPGFKLSLKRGIAGEYSSSTEASENQPEPNALQIKASGVGRLLLAHPDDSIVLAPVGSDIQPGQLVAILTVGTLLLPVRSQHAGQVCSVLVANGATVSYGQPLINLLPFDADAVQP